jgi:hypothetical protein
MGRCVLAYHWHAEFMLNCARLAAKLSVHPRGRKVIMKDPRLPNTIVALMQYQCQSISCSGESGVGDRNGRSNHSMLQQQNALWLSGSVRACFALGNLIAGNPKTREALGTPAVLDCLVELLAQLTEMLSSDRTRSADGGAACAGTSTGAMKDVGVGTLDSAPDVDRNLIASGRRWGQDETGPGDGEETQVRSTEGKHNDFPGSLRSFHGSNSANTEEQVDLLAKVARCLANLALDCGLADRLGRRQEVSCLVDVVQLAQDDQSFPSSCGQNARHELLLNAMAASTNLSFYDDDDNALWAARGDLLQALANVLLSRDSPSDCVHEALRGLGNLSRDLSLHDEIVSVHSTFDATR